jgi:hypothetical protein
MPSDDAHSPPYAAEQIAPKSAPRTDDRSPDRDQIADPCWHDRVRRTLSSANSTLSYLIGLPLVTVLGGLLVGYYQYLNAYEEKVRIRAERDVRTATATFTEISKKFSEAQMIQQAIFSDFSTAFDDNAGAEEQAAAARHAKAIAPAYEKAWIGLLESGDAMARNAEIHIDWATDLHRTPGDDHYPNSDPLSRSLLRDYDFDCNGNFPTFVWTEPVYRRKADSCQNFGDDGAISTLICSRRKDDANQRPPVAIQWYSAKHLVLTMDYCFHALHQRMAKVHSWAAHGGSGPAIEPAFRAEREQLKKEIDNQTSRLEAFMGLAVFQIEAVREKYRPLGSKCHLPFVSWWDDACKPLPTTPFVANKTNDVQKQPAKTVSAAAPP